MIRSLSIAIILIVTVGCGKVANEPYPGPNSIRVLATQAALNLGPGETVVINGHALTSNGTPAGNQVVVASGTETPTLTSTPTQTPTDTQTPSATPTQTQILLPFVARNDPPGTPRIYVQQPQIEVHVVVQGVPVDGIEVLFDVCRDAAIPSTEICRDWQTRLAKRAKTDATGNSGVATWGEDVPTGVWHRAIATISAANYGFPDAPDNYSIYDEYFYMQPGQLFQRVEFNLP